MNYKKLCATLLAGFMLLSWRGFLWQICYGSDTKRVPADFKTIQEAIDNSAAGTLILVSAGVYYEQLTIDKPLTLQVENQALTIIDGNVSGVCIKITVADVVVAGFKIQNALIGITMQNITGVQIVNNTVTGASREGIVLLNSQGNAIVNNTLTRNGDGVHLVSSNNNAIINNVVSDNFGCGISLESSANNCLEGNRLSANHNKGVLLIDSNDNVIESNAISLSNDDGGFLQRSHGNILAKNVMFGNYHCGFCLVDSSNNSLSENVLDGNWWHGLEFYHSNENKVVNNIEINNKNVGVFLFSSGNNFLRNNTMTSNSFNFRVSGEALEDFLNDVDCSNSVDGKKLYYLVNESGLRVPSDAGYVAVVNSSDVLVSDLSLSCNGQGVLFAYTSNSCVTWVNASDNLYGVHLFHAENNRIEFSAMLNNTFGFFVQNSSDNMFFCNDVFHSLKGVVVMQSQGNSFFRNNFVNNTHPVDIFQSSSFWDSGFEGNYWDVYSGIDADSDGIGDVPFVLDENNCDNRPLMRFYVPGDVNHDGVVDSFDAGLVGRAWLSVCGELGYDYCADLNMDGLINIIDATFVGMNWQRTGLFDVG
jgi:parallel beta-helix repeat protein